MENQERIVRISIIGVGGGGTNSVERMLDANIPMVKYATLNTDDGGFLCSRAQTKLQIGRRQTNGRGAGGNPEKGKLSAEENAIEIEQLLSDCDMVFVTAGMGGGTGTGAAPVVAKIAQKLGILTVAVVTQPFAFEGSRRMRQAQEGIKNLEAYADALIVIPNENLKHVADTRITLYNAFAIADDVLMQTVKNLVELIQSTAFINCDFADITSVLRKSGYTHIATGRAVGKDKTQKVIDQVKCSRLMNTAIDGASGVLLYITVAGNVALEDVDAVSSAVSEIADPIANIIFGLHFDESLDDEIKVLLVATHRIDAGTDCNR